MSAFGVALVGNEQRVYGMLAILLLLIALGVALMGNE